MPAPPGDDRTAAAALPVAVAIGVFGVVYGAVAGPELGRGLAVASSFVIFSGAAQFTMVGLLAGGSTSAGIILSVIPLALRHVPLGAVVRPRLPASRVRRALLSWFLIDETAGLALARGGAASRTLAVAGALSYGAWIVGTVAGVYGASVASIEPIADALFPVLFVGLAAVTATRTGDAARAIIAGVGALVLLLAVPDAGVLGALGVAVAVAAVGVRP